MVVVERHLLASMTSRVCTPLRNNRSTNQKSFQNESLFEVDLSQPLVFQVGYLGEKYDSWVHQPIISKESPRFFSSDFCEFFSKTQWWVVPLVWLPAVFWMESTALRKGLPVDQLLGFLLGGILLWSLVEYSLHRFLFHMKTTSYWSNTLHYIFHGCHHKHPSDRLRLVFPPVAASILAFPLFVFFRCLLSGPVTMAVFGGGLLGYIHYDLTHYYLHHGSPRDKVVKERKMYHMRHHFKMQSHGFGITSKFWDRMFGTVIPERKS